MINLDQINELSDVSKRTSELAEQLRIQDGGSHAYLVEKDVIVIMFEDKMPKKYKFITEEFITSYEDYK